MRIFARYCYTRYLDNATGSVSVSGSDIVMS